MRPHLAIELGQYWRILTNINVLPFQPLLEALWKLPDEIICEGIDIRYKRDFNPNYLQLLYIEHINLYHSDSIKFFTDGSKSNEGTGCAYFTVSSKEIFKLDKYLSVISAELYTILQILQYIESNKNRNYTILSDSKSSIQAINSMNSSPPIVSKIQSWIIMLQSRHKRVQFCGYQAKSVLTATNRRIN